MSPHRTSDAEDVRLTLDGDREAFGRLYDRHACGVRAVVVAVSGDFNAVDDLTQETFLRGYRRLVTLKDSTGFRQWIHGIARLVAKERRRAIGRDRHRFDAENNGLVEADNTPAVIEQNEERHRVLSALSELPERERLVLHAFYFHEQSADQAAASIGISRSGFYAALERGLNRLRRRLGVSSLSTKMRSEK